MCPLMLVSLNGSASRWQAPSSRAPASGSRSRARRRRRGNFMRESVDCKRPSIRCATTCFRSPAMLRQTVRSSSGLLVGRASAVLLGAFGAHALRGVLDPAHRELWHTAVEYHAWHALALVLAVGLGAG